LELLPFLAHLAFRPCELLPSLFVIPSTFHILIFSSETTGPAKFGLIWFSGFRGEDLNVIFYQNMPNLHNLYKSAERKKNTTITKNRNFFKWPKLLYFKPECVQI
jgi:hypothetical protein